MVLADFKRQLEQTTIGKSSRDIHRTACAIWNYAVEAFPDWPQRKVTVPDYRRVYALPREDFPPTLKIDVDAWLARLAGTDILDGNDFKPLKPITLRCRERELHEFVSALVHQGSDPARLTTLAELVPVDTVKKALRFFLDRADKTPLQACRMAGMSIGVAKHWVNVPADHLKRLQSIRNRLDTKPKGLTAKNKSRLLQIEDPARRDALLGLPGRLDKEATELAKNAKTAKSAKTRKSKARTDFQRALMMQNAVAVELLTMVPLRIKNLAHLKIDGDLIW